MRSYLTPILGLTLACSSLASQSNSSPRVTPDIASQRVLRQYGVESQILRSYDELQDQSTRSDGCFRFILSGDSGIDVVLDRDYWVLVSWPANKSHDEISYMLNPKDEQSALVISIGKGTHKHTGIDWKLEPGFSGVAQRDCVLAVRRVTWRRWSYSSHLHSDCTAALSLDGEVEGNVLTVFIDVTANTESRRKALEDCLSSLRLCKSAEEPNLQ